MQTQVKGQITEGFVQIELIPLRAKRVGEFIEIRHKKISPLGVCHSVTLQL